MFVDTLQCSHESQETRRMSLWIGVDLPPKISTMGTQGPGAQNMAEFLYEFSLLHRGILE